MQGGELDVIRGAEQSLNLSITYAEISFKEFYDGQPLASKIISTLNSLGFELVGVYNVQSRCGENLQADALFRKDSKLDL